MSQGFRNRYPTYNVLDKWDTPSWNDQTRAVVAKRLHEIPPRRFFSETEWELAQAICDRLIPQPDRPDDPVPIVPFIDEKLHENQGDGYRYEDPAADSARPGGSACARSTRRRAPAGSAAFASCPAIRRTRCCARCSTATRSPMHGRACRPKQFFKSVLLHEVGQHLLRAPGGVERDRVRRPGLAARLCPDAGEPARPVGARWTEKEENER